ncbi:uncharacterized protein I206_103688 [Kwoniella pini CBS 10737]|uniref:Histone H2A n=1 Tax=Kwoniella pini CBS 10737 TaxID=1296096 RepID=A0A1B9I8X7_9TREE|nr:uncharacterized protein I206_01312 [Kwoniella pini CBS 10737]OCF52028.1 hypothetical protein I206_01312 [Kwoniella pini CBS 10737]
MEQKGCGTKKSIKSGLTFPVTRVRKYLVRGRYAHTIQWSAAICMAAVLEYLTAELLEVAGDTTHDHKKKTISPRYIQLAIQTDKELGDLLPKVVIAQGGVLPKIHPELRKKKKRPSQNATNASTGFEESGPGKRSFISISISISK